MKTKDFLPFSMKMLEAGLPFLVQGSPGMGKTTLLETAAQRLGYNYLIFLLGVKNPIEIGGVPAQTRPGTAKTDAVWDFIPVGDLRRMVEATEPLVVILDDFGQGMTATMNAASHLIQARQVGEQPISKHVRICATTNTAEHKSGANPILENAKSRFRTIVKLDEDVDSWLEWAQNCQDVGLLNQVVEFPPIVTAFIMFKRDMLYGFKPMPGLANSNTPRTVHNMAQLVAADALTERIAFEALEGAAGRPITIEFLAFLKMWAHLPDIEDVLNDPNTLDSMTFEKFVWDDSQGKVVSVGQAHVTQRPDVATALITSAADIIEPCDMDNFTHLLTKFDKPYEAMGMLMVKNKGREYLETSAFVRWAINNQAIMAP